MPRDMRMWHETCPVSHLTHALLPQLSYRAETSCVMLTLVDGTAVTQCKLHTMEIEPIEPISMEVMPHSPAACL